MPLAMDIAIPPQEKHMTRREKTPRWFRIAVWSGMALVALLLAWLIGVDGGNAMNAITE